MPPQPTGTTSTSGDAVTDRPQMTKDKTGTRSVCKRLFWGTESNPSSRDSFLCAQGSTSTEVNQPLDAVLVGGLQQSISASFIKWVQDWQGAARAWQRDNFVKVWKHSSLPPQHLAEAGTDIAGTWRNFHVQQPETGSTYPHHYRTNVSLQDKWQLITSYF